MPFCSESSDTAGDKLGGGIRQWKRENEEINLHGVTCVVVGER